MANEQIYENMLPKINELPPKEVRYPDMPVDQALKEAEIMAAAVREDSDKFIAVGIEEAKIDELAMAITTLRIAQARLVAALGELKEAARQWEIEEPAAYELRAELLAAVAYALRNIPDAIKAIKRIREGSRKSGLIQDLQALYELATKYLVHLQAINFDTTLIATAGLKADELGKLHAKAFLEKSTAGVKDIRDRAFTYMRRLMGEMLETAEYIFRKDRSKLEFYYSSYRRQRNATAEEPEPEAENEPQPAAEPAVSA